MKQTLAGGTGDFVLVRRLVLHGSQHDIGRALAEEVQASFPPAPSLVDPTPSLNRARRRWFEHNWPQHAARARGIAEVYGLDPGNDAAPAEVPAVPFHAGCSALWCPPVASADGHARLGRNFDFMTGSALEIAGLPPDDLQPPMMSRPYIIEMHPDEGYASIALSACDLSGCFDGCNEAGLAVALFADDESTTLRPTLQLQAGIHELQLPRFLLDTCATTDEAVEALYGAKQYDHFITCHYLVADARGNAFVWERDTHNAERVVRAGDAPLCVTNYLLHRYDDVNALPADEAPNNMYERARTLAHRAEMAPLSGEDISSALEVVRARGADVVGRTIWSSLYDLEERALTVDFYLGEGGDGTQRRSESLTYTLAA